MFHRQIAMTGSRAPLGVFASRLAVMQWRGGVAARAKPRPPGNHI